MRHSAVFWRLGWWGLGLGSLLGFVRPAWALELTEIQTLMNPDCVQFAVLGPCYCNLYTPCVVVGYWEPAWLVETVKVPGSTSLGPMGALMAAAWQALGLPPLGGGGAGGTSPGSGRTNLHFSEAHVATFPPVVTGPCDGCQSTGALQVHYLSEVDPLWRSATGGSGLEDVLGLGQLGVWAPLYPRTGFAITSSEPVSSGIGAARAIDIAAHPTGNASTPEYRVVLQQIPRASQCCQLASPKQTGCFPAGTTPARWEHGTGSRDGTYLWIWWRYRACCVDTSQAFCGLALLGGYGANTCVK